MDSNSEDDYFERCERCNKGIDCGDYCYEKDCIICNKHVCIECVAMTSCQTTLCECKNCFKFNCIGCNTNIYDKLKNISMPYVDDDGEDLLYCQKCIDKE